MPVLRWGIGDYQRDKVQSNANNVLRRHFKNGRNKRVYFFLS